jgi:hypothetical protein
MYESYQTWRGKVSCVCLNVIDKKDRLQECPMSKSYRKGERETNNMVVSYSSNKERNKPATDV